MERFNRKGFDEDQIDSNYPDERYDMAYKRMKRIKGFYIHFLVYVLVNSFLLVSKYYNHSGDNFLDWDNFSGSIFWGIGLIAHGFSVFGNNLFFGDHWEERKIKEFMDKDKESKWE